MLSESKNNLTPKESTPAELKEGEINFCPDFLIHFIQNVASPEVAAACLDKAMLYLVQYIVQGGIANEDHAETYWHLRQMRNAILKGSNNITLD